ncbi:MAG: tripartite tricarboxylate transporter substrate binding protein [Syntrophales bacterium]|jgi:tripartite-type tricarboxylate transporter receptor subunit TctC|nr:tripartite tricarboxylate transporter substrate binding protein [Syntrophales bacterium]
MGAQKHKAWLGAIALGFLMLTMTASSSWSQSAFPTKPINILVSYAAGGVVDTTTRALCVEAEKILGQPLIITNNGAAGATVAAGIVAKEKPDGYHLLSTASAPFTRIPHIRHVQFDRNDFIPIMQHARTASGLVVLADSPFKTVKDLVEFARKNPGKVTYSTLGIGSAMHMSMLYIAKQEGITWTHVPYNGSMPTVTALLGGHVTAASSSTEWKPFVQEGRLRLLATHDLKRNRNFPNVPTLKELGYDFYNDSTFLILAPKGTPTDIVKKLEDAFHKAYNSQAYQDTLTRIDHTPAYLNSEDTREFLDAAYKLNGKWVNDLKIPKEKK